LPRFFLLPLTFLLSWGSSWLSLCHLSIPIKSLVWNTNISFLVLSAIMKSVEGLVYLLEPSSFGSLLSHSFFYDLFAWMR
jgi:hypothetical protein